MENVESIDAFYKRKFGDAAFGWMPDTLKSELGHFNVFPLEPVEPGKAKPLPYKRRDFYKIMLVRGDIEVHYADRMVPIARQALVFSHPLIPYKCEHLERITGGAYCIFNEQFFSGFKPLGGYSVFQPNGDHVFELSDAQADEVATLFGRMSAELGSEYVHKYDLLRMLVLEGLHYAMKMRPSIPADRPPLNASQRITTLFLELLERQFPIDEHHPGIRFRSASDFAGQLNVHVNHLNRAVKEITFKTTTQLIAERLVQEAKLLLRQSPWPVAAISDALGFPEVTHFTSFFKQHTDSTPLKFRNAAT